MLNFSFGKCCSNSRVGYLRCVRLAQLQIVYVCGINPEHRSTCTTCIHVHHILRGILFVIKRAFINQPYSKSKKEVTNQCQNEVTTSKNMKRTEFAMFVEWISSANIFVPITDAYRQHRERERGGQTEFHSIIASNIRVGCVNSMLLSEWCDLRRWQRHVQRG